ncbi:probable 2-ketogluconate reductase [Platichthys flesus]|uniref:probable 2-ketogluconate reductase n=1 Tax=Platichthys flesus TaxID=8260 RepID=UPI002DBD4B09|nr:probable 2-ketogluconate reductase [Platichthys flesus]
MEKEKPWGLVSEEGVDQNVLNSLSDVLKHHFQILFRTEFLQNPQLHGPKIQALFVWSWPAAEHSLISLLPSLKLVSNGGAGTDHLDVQLINSRGVKVTNTPGAVSNSTADMAMALLLASARRIVESLKNRIEDTILPRSLRGVEVTVSTLGIVGMGEIGYKIAQRSKGFDMKILYHKRTRRLNKEEAVGATYCLRLDELLTRADFVVLAISPTPDATGLISQREVSLMKPEATLVNISGGLVLDQDALVKALQSVTICAAVLDVTHPQRLPRSRLRIALS